MVSSLETGMSSRVVLFTILVQITYGTFFPPPSNSPPIPARGVTTLNNGPPGFYLQDDLPQDFPQPLARDEGLFLPDAKADDQRWYLQENQSDEGSQFSRSADTFERYYQSGEPAIGPVATPIPDDASYIAQSSSIPRLNQNDPGNSEVWILTRGSENQYVPQRWIQVRIPSERVVEVVNQDSGPPPVATDPVKSVIAPEVPVISQFTPNSSPNIVQQVWVQAPKSIDSAAYGKSATIVEEIPSVKQIVDIPPANGKQVFQQQVIKNAPPPIKSPAPILNAKTFSVPPPLPPPLKGDISSKSVPPVNVIPDSNVIVGGKNSVYQRLRHVWIPTSSSTGKFITFPIQAGIDTGKSVVNADISLAPTPITVSDTWVLKQNGPLTGFEQQKSVLQSPAIQGGKVIIQNPNPSVVQVNNPTSPKIIAQISSPKAPIGKGVISNNPADIWPVRKDASSKVSGKSFVVGPDISVSQIQPDTISISKGLPLPPVAPQPILTKSAIPPSVLPPSLQVVNGKPCPLPPPVPQKSLFPAPSPPIISVPRVIGTSRLPLTRIIRVNRYPTGNYYLLNTGTRPNYFTYPRPAVIQQPKTGLIQVVQPKQISLPIQGKQNIYPPQGKRIAIPVQSRQFIPPVPAKQVAFPFVARQAIVPLPQKSTRIIYPTIQAIRYPWSGLSNYRPIPGKGILLPQLSALKILQPASKSDSSSSSESNSSESSSSESEEKKEEKPKKEEKAKKEDKSKEEKPKKEKEEKSESEESSSSSEGEKESPSEEKESEESTSESKNEEESIEAAESQVLHAPANIAVLPNFDHILNQESGTRVTTVHGHNYQEGFNRESRHETNPRTESHASTHTNFILSHAAHQQGETGQRSEGSTDSLTTEFDRD